MVVINKLFAMDSDEYNTDEEKLNKQVSKKPRTSYKHSGKKVLKLYLNLEEFKDWLTTDDTGTLAKCKVCSADLKGGRSELKRHSDTKIHQRNMQAKKIQPSISSFVPQNYKIKQLEAAMCTFIVEYDLPISFVEPLAAFCKALPDKNTIEKL